MMKKSDGEKKMLAFPPPTGSFAVGCRCYHWERSLKSAPHEVRRPLTAVCWFPCASEGPRGERVPVDLTKLVSAQFSGLGLHSEEWASISCVQSWSHSGGSPVRIHSLPLVIYSHGVGMNSWAGAIWCEELASQGYVVVGVEHAGFSAEAAQRRQPSLSHLPMMQMRELYHDDIKFVVDSLMNNAWNDDVALAIDRERIGLLGHSLGGGAAWQCLWQDERIGAAVSMDGILTNRVFKKLPHYLSKPLLLIFCQSDEREFFPSECGPPSFDVPAHLQIESESPPQTNFSIITAADFPKVNIINMILPHCGHFSFTLRVLLKLFLFPMKRIANDNKESTSSVDHSSSLGVGNPELDVESFIRVSRQVCVNFFDQVFRSSRLLPDVG